MNSNTELSSGFVSDLEDQLARELRRKQRFGQPDQRSGLKRRAGMAALLIICMATGVAGARTAEHLESARTAEFLAQRAETEIELLQARQAAARELAREMETRVEAGLINARELAEAKRRAALLGHELDRARLNLEETRLALRAPSDELYAQLAEERDFVAERLELERKIVLERKAGIDARMERMEQLVAEGMVHDSEAARVEAELATAQRELEEVQRRLDLRADYVAGELTAREVCSRDMLQQVEARLQAAQAEAEMVAHQAAKMARLRAKGMITEAEAREAEVREAMARAQERLAQFELQLLEQETAEREPEADEVPE